MRSTLDDDNYVRIVRWPAPSPTVTGCTEETQLNRSTAFVRTSRRGWRTTLVAAVSSSLLVLPSTSVPGFSATNRPPLPPGLEDITNSDEGQAKAKTAFAAWRAAGQEGNLRDVRTYRMESKVPETEQPFYVISTRFAPVTEAQESVLEDGSVHAHAAVLVDSELLEEERAKGQPASTAHAGYQYHSGNASDNGSFRVENSTGHSDTWWRVNYKGIDSSDGRYIWAVNQEATFSSHSVYEMYQARIRSVPRTNYIWLDFDPNQDMSRSTGCISWTLGVNGGGASASVGSTWCDKWDIWYDFNNPGRFDNTWNGYAHRTDRHVEYLHLVKRGNKNWAFEFHNDFWARLM